MKRRQGPSEKKYKEAWFKHPSGKIGKVFKHPWACKRIIAFSLCLSSFQGTKLWEENQTGVLDSM
jgi:hypothetical protein